MENSIFDQERFDRVWARVDPSSVPPPPCAIEQAQRFLTLLLAERTAAKIYEGFAKRSRTAEGRRVFTRLARQKGTMFCRLAAAYFLMTGEKSPKTVVGKSGAPTMDALRERYLYEKGAADRYRTEGRSHEKGIQKAFDDGAALCEEAAEAICGLLENAVAPKGRGQYKDK